MLAEDPGNWLTTASYTATQDIIQNLKVVNDLTEHGVALIQKFNATITRDKKWKQYLLQVVKQHHKQFLAPTKGIFSDIKQNFDTV